MSTSATCVIAEDEQIFRQALTKLLTQQWPDMRVLASCEDGSEALEAIAEHQPSVAFLDIRMPGLTGLDVAAAAAEISPHTHVVFVTAYDQYAIDAFEKGAVDYLLKPIEPTRLANTISRLRSRIDKGGGEPGELAALIANLSNKLSQRNAQTPLVWLTASTGKESKLIMVEDVLYFQSDNKYTSVFTAEGEALLRTPLKDINVKLNPNQFKQIHRATIVNMKAVDSITRDESGRGTLKLKGRSEHLTVSLSYMPLFRNM